MVTACVVRLARWYPELTGRGSAAVRHAVPVRCRFRCRSSPLARGWASRSDRTHCRCRAGLTVLEVPCEFAPSRHRARTGAGQPQSMPSRITRRPSCAGEPGGSPAHRFGRRRLAAPEASRRRAAGHAAPLAARRLSVAPDPRNRRSLRPGMRPNRSCGLVTASDGSACLSPSRSSALPSPDRFGSRVRAAAVAIAFALRRPGPGARSAEPLWFRADWVCCRPVRTDRVQLIAPTMRPAAGSSGLAVDHARPPRVPRGLCQAA